MQGNALNRELERCKACQARLWDALVRAEVPGSEAVCQPISIYFFVALLGVSRLTFGTTCQCAAPHQRNKASPEPHGASLAAPVIATANGQSGRAPLVIACNASDKPAIEAFAEMGLLAPGCCTKLGRLSWLELAAVAQAGMQLQAIPFFWAQLAQRAGRLLAAGLPTEVCALPAVLQSSCCQLR